MHTRRIIAVAALAAGALALSACGTGGGPGPGAFTSKGPIKIWYSNNAQEVTWGEQVVKSWNRLHPDQKVTGQQIPAGKTSEEVIGASITAGNAPCLIYNTAPAAVGQFQKQGGLVDLSKFPGGAAYINSRSGALAKQYQDSTGQYYQLPWKSNPVEIFYNRKLFTKAGLDPNKPNLSTYADFIATSKKLVAAKVARYAILPAPTSEYFQSNFDFYPLYAAQTGGKLLIDDKKATFDNAAGLDVAQFWSTMYKDKLAGQEAYAGDAFADGVAAMAIVGPWAVATYKGKVSWGSVPVPTKAGTAASKIWTFSDAKNIGLYTACTNQLTAWNFLKYSTSKAEDSKLLSITGQMPIRTNLATTYAAYFKANPSYNAFGAQAARTVEDPPGPNAIEELQDFRDAWSQAVIFQGGNLKATLSGAAAKLNHIETQP